MKRYPLWPYVIGVVIVLAAVNYVAWYVGSKAKAKSLAIFSISFLMGMLSMYICSAYL